MRHFAVVGSGPAGFYTAEALEKAYGEQARIDILDRYPVPYGLIRFGVAPDHQSLKAVSKRYDKVAESAGVDFIGNVTSASDVSVAELLELYDAVILAIGAPHDRKLGIPGEDLPGVVGSAEFVGWYNGHPEFADLDPPLDGTPRGGHRQRQCRARLRADPVEDAGTSSKARTSSAMRSTRSTSRRSAPITILGRRGPHQIAMTPKELGELGHLEDALPVVDLGDFPPRRGRRRARAGPAQIGHDPARFRRHPRQQAQAHGLRLLRQAAPRSKATAKPNGSSSSGPSSTKGRRARHRRNLRSPGVAGHQLHRLLDPADRRRSPMTSAAASSSTTAARSPTGCIAVGWARRGPTGTIGTNRPDGYEVADRIAADNAAGKLVATAPARRA